MKSTPATKKIQCRSSLDASKFDTLPQASAQRQKTSVGVSRGLGVPVYSRSSSQNANVPVAPPATAEPEYCCKLAVALAGLTRS